jgi:hypothetical protein
MISSFNFLILKKNRSSLAGKKCVAPFSSFPPPLTATREHFIDVEVVAKKSMKLLYFT